MSMRLKLRNALRATFAAAMLLCLTPGVFADKLHLKDGRVLDGTVVREVDGVIFFKVKVGGIEKEEMFTPDQVSKVERTSTDPVTDPAPNVETTPGGAPALMPVVPSDVKPKGAKEGGPTRVAFLYFGPPSAWGEEIDDMVGITACSSAFKEAVPLLKKDNVDVVVVQVNSGGGLTLELDKFHKLFQEEYKPNFRTVCWVEYAGSCAAMSPYVIEEYYFMPNGALGGCVEFSGGGRASQGAQLEEVLFAMEKASKLANRSPLLMRAMQIQMPLSASVDKVTGEVKFYADETSGDILLQRSNQVLTINASEAEQIRFSQGTAATRDELMKKMKITEYVWAGKEATDYMENFIRESDKANKYFGETYTKYNFALEVAQSLEPGTPERGAELGKAKRLLNEMKRLRKMNPNFEFMLGLDENFFNEQDRIIKELQKQRPRNGGGAGR